MRSLSRCICSLMAAAAVAATNACTSPNYRLDLCRQNGSGAPAAGRWLDHGTLRVLTVNMWGIPLVARDIEARFEALAERLNGDDAIDLVALQEMWTDAPRQRFLAKVRARYPYQADFQSLHDRSGLVILSRHEIVGAPRFTPFADTGKWWKPWTGEWSGGKGVGAVQLRTSAGPLWFVTTHLHACYERSEHGCDQNDEYAWYRWRQLQTLRQVTNEWAGETPAVIAGDFNFTTSSPYPAFLAAAGNAGEEHDPAWIRVDEPGAPQRRIDYIWIRPGRNRSWAGAEAVVPALSAPLRLPDGERVPLSDHCAIATSLEPVAVESPLTAPPRPATVDVSPGEL